MRVAVVSWWKRQAEKELSQAGFDVVKDNPEAVVCLGGEGTFLFSELEYPGIPKLLLRHHCTDCKRHDYRDILEKLKAGRYRVEEAIKLAGAVNGKKGKPLAAMNEISVHFSPPCAIGITVSVDGKQLAGNLMGDGVVVATPYGSTAYYHSITRKTFKSGIGIAFNNPQVQTGSIVVAEDSVVRVEVTKGEGYMAADCCRKIVKLKKGDIVEVRKWPEPARIIVIEGCGEKIDI